MKKSKYNWHILPEDGYPENGTEVLCYILGELGQTYYKLLTYVKDDESYSDNPTYKMYWEDLESTERRNWNVIQWKAFKPAEE